MNCYIDSHCHFDFPEFDQDRQAVWKRCAEIGVTKLIIPAVAPDSWERTRRISERHTGIYYSLGLHPWWVEKWTEKHAVDIAEKRLAELIEHSAQNTNCVAVGECGLDKGVSFPLDLQIPYFERQLKAAAALSKPIIIHCVKAHNETIRLLKKYRPPAGGVIHAFSGSAELAQSYWDLGFHLGIGGTITYQRAGKTRDAVRQLPLEVMVLETDAPDMPFSGRQGQRNSPIYLPEIADALADIRKQPLEQIASQTSANASQLFGLATL